MRYKLLGRSGLRVSEICLGTMTFGKEWGWGADPAECRRMFDMYCELGGNFIDTANHYTNGTSESLLGEFLGNERERFVIATKYSLNARPQDPNAGGNHRKSMMQALDASLRRLKTDYVDLYWVHVWDFSTPIDEVVRGLDDMVRAGKVLYVGISDAPAWVVARANTIAELRGWSRFVGLQINYSLIERSAERELIPMAQSLDLAVTAWAPLGGGMLTGKYRRGGARPQESRFSVEGSWGDMYLTNRNYDIADEVGVIAAEVGATHSQVALAWLRQNNRGVIIPIVGCRTARQLEENLGAAKVMLSENAMKRLDEASRIELGFPHDFLGLEWVREAILGHHHARVDQHRVRD